MKRILSELRIYLCNHIISSIPSITLRMFYYRKVMGFTIGKGSYIFLNCKFDAAKGLKIGENSVVNSNCRIDTRGDISIGNNVSISENVIILTADHDMDQADMAGRNRGVTIEDYTWIGTRAIIMPDIKINFAAVIAAGAVVTKNVEDYNVVAGVPAKFIKLRKTQSQFTYVASYKRLFQ